MPVIRIQHANASRCRRFGLLSALHHLLCTAALLLVCTGPAAAQNTASPKTGTRASDFVPADTAARVDTRTGVRWSSWQDAAFDRARQEKKPVLLLIEDQNDFWCNTMLRDVFTRSEVIDELNGNFVCIRVNHEERPDVASIYRAAMHAYYQLAGSIPPNEWPVILFLTPEQQPFAAGTYFPLTRSGNLPGFPQVLRDAYQAWTTREADARTTAALIVAEVKKRMHPGSAAKPVRLDSAMLSKAAIALTETMNAKTGGWPLIPGQKPSQLYPFPVRLQFLQSRIGRDESVSLRLASQVNLTLDEISAGGIHDHLAGGFHHAGRDGDWLVPCFQKSLTENALLAEVFLDAYRRTGRESYRRTAERIFDFVQHDLTAGTGAFLAGIGSDVNEIDGRYYSWTRDELESVLSPSDYRLFSAAYGLNRPHTFPAGHLLALHVDLNETARQLAVPMKELDVRLGGIRTQLREIRRRRTAPHRDDHIVTSGNGLMIRAFAAAGKVLKRRDYVDSAERAALRLLSEHRDSNGRLLHCVLNRQNNVPAVLDDYACFVSGLLALHETTGEEKWLNAARRLTDDQISAFWDQQQFGFFETAVGQPAPLLRIKSAVDGELPSGNAVSVQNLIRLSRLKADESYRTHASRTLLLFAGTIQASPEKSCSIAMALQDYLHWFGSLESQGRGSEGLFAGGISSPREVPVKPSEEVPLTRDPAKPAAETPVLTKKLTSENQGPGSVPQLPVVETRGLLKVRGSMATHPLSVTANGVLESDTVTPGQRVAVAIEIQVPDDWGVIASSVRREGLAPLAVTVVSPRGCEIQELAFSRPQQMRHVVNGESIEVSRGQVDAIGWLTIPGQLKGEQELILRLDYQLSQDHRSLPPQELLLVTPLQVRQDDQAPVSLHSKTIEAAKSRVQGKEIWQPSLNLRKP